MNSMARFDDLTRTAIAATLHCLTGCAIGEVLGMAVATAFGLGQRRFDRPVHRARVLLRLPADVAAAAALRPAPRRVAGLALASDTFSITTMEIVDSLVILAVPGAMAAGLGDPLFWGSLAFALFVAFWAAVPVNRWLIARGKGHAVVHAHHA